MLPSPATPDPAPTNTPVLHRYCPTESNVRGHSSEEIDVGVTRLLRNISSTSILPSVLAVTSFIVAVDEDDPVGLLVADPAASHTTYRTLLGTASMSITLKEAFSSRNPSQQRRKDFASISAPMDKSNPMGVE